MTVLLPPTNLEQLRRLYAAIYSGNGDIRLTQRTRRVLKKMLDEPDETATKSISEIAAENDVNISSITRLAQKLGFEGFAGLRDLFRSNLKRRQTFYSKQVKKFLQQGHNGRVETEHLLQQVIQDEWVNVMRLADGFDQRTFDTVIGMIAGAARVFVIGLRSSYPMAYYLGLYLNMIRDNVLVVGRSGHCLAEDLSPAGPRDLVIAISFSPYTRATVEACRAVRQQKAGIVAITDSVSSPLANETDTAVIAPTRGDFFFTPVVAAMVFIETLLSELVNKLGPKAIDRLNQTESFLDTLQVEI
jgi:DNA-binding MurR/RpiR family transcriptional regulator